MINKEFQKELEVLINKHNLEEIADMPDYLLADAICRIIEAIGPRIKAQFDKHRCDGVMMRLEREERRLKFKERELAHEKERFEYEQLVIVNTI